MSNVVALRESKDPTAHPCGESRRLRPLCSDAQEHLTDVARRMVRRGSPLPVAGDVPGRERLAHDGRASKLVTRKHSVIPGVEICGGGRESKRQPQPVPESGRCACSCARRSGGQAAADAAEDQAGGAGEQEEARQDGEYGEDGAEEPRVLGAECLEERQGDAGRDGEQSEQDDGVVDVAALIVPGEPVIVVDLGEDLGEALGQSVVPVECVQ